MNTRQLTYLAGLVFNQPHLIEPGHAEVIAGVLLRARTKKGEALKAENPEVQALYGESEKRGPKDFHMLPNGIGVIPIMGTLVQRHDWLAAASGMTSYSKLSQTLVAAMRDDSVEEILFHMDSVGGVVDGCFDFVGQVREARKKKKITAFADGKMASAAYAIGSAATRVIASETSKIGSIGVLMMHVDRSAFLKEQGITITHIKSGEEKDLGTDIKPLSGADRDKLQARVDETADIFFAHVNQNRSQLSVEQVRDMEAGIFLAQEAMGLGLIDAVSSYQALLENLTGMEYGSWIRYEDESYRIQADMAAEQPQGGNDMTKEQQTALALKMGLSEDATLEQILAASPQVEQDPRTQGVITTLGLASDASASDVQAEILSLQHPTNTPDDDRLKTLEAKLAKQEKITLVKDALSNGQISQADMTWFGDLDMATQQKIIDKRPVGSVVPVRQSMPAPNPESDPANPKNAVLNAEQRAMNRMSGLSDDEFIKYNEGRSITIGQPPRINPPSAAQ